MEEEKANCEARFQSTKTHAGNLRHTLEIAKEKDAQKRDHLKNVDYDITQFQKKIQNAKGQGENRLMLFGGDSMPRIVADVQKYQGRFRKMPVGPLGMEIQLKPNVSKQKAALIGHEIGGLLNAFIVDNFDVSHYFSRFNLKNPQLFQNSQFENRNMEIEDQRI